MIHILELPQNKIITSSTFKNVDKKKLEEFVISHPNGNIFQSTRIYEFFNLVNNYEPNLIVLYENNKIIGSLLFVIVKEGNGVKGYLSRRCIVWGGPLVNDNNNRIYLYILTYFNKITSKRLIYTEFRNYCDITMQKDVFKNAGYMFFDHFNYLISIISLEKSKAKISNSKKRQINISIKNGAKIIEADSIEKVKEFYNILKILYLDKIKKPIPSFDFFEEFFKSKKLGKYFLILYKENVIGGILCPIYKDTIYEWFVCGLDREFKNVYPSVLATWAPIQYAANNGLKYFDFMGAGKPDQDYGVREFKSKFGGKLVNFGRFIKIHNHFFYNLGKNIIELKQKLL